MQTLSFAAKAGNITFEQKTPNPIVEHGAAVVSNSETKKKPLLSSIMMRRSSSSSPQRRRNDLIRPPPHSPPVVESAVPVPTVPVAQVQKRDEEIEEDNSMNWERRKILLDHLFLTSKIANVKKNLIKVEYFQKMKKI